MTTGSGARSWMVRTSIAGDDSATQEIVLPKLGTQLGSGTVKVVRCLQTSDEMHSSRTWT
jgi:hypothetical protein